ncbi:hypothetical protein RND71_038252 [Anisodus tanguticus]|uniref:Uncharacterized protein n=1 Tax=Anisodus tanguticus TaxID=243964 RepID=A0AAE1R035_9SOLA|nr:hypothetical protein RND71_038252 [Anisodus tanguticus]
MGERNPPPKANFQQLLKKSLSQILARFYSFSGRINDDYTLINCNNYGVPFFEAFAHNYYLDEIIEPNSYMKLLRRFLLESLLSPTIPILVQVTFFECGGMTIGICASHKITDAPTLNTFINGWAIAAHRDPQATMLDFVPTAKFLPPVDNNQLQLLFLQPKKVNNVTKIFFFDAPRITTLKAKAVSDNVLVPTRVEALSTLIGNENKDKVDLPDLVLLLRKGLLEFHDEYENKRRGHTSILEIVNDAMGIEAQIERDDMEMYNFTSWCRFQFYDADFGWGSPLWVSRIEFEATNHVLLMDTRCGGGIKAWVSLDKEEMKIFFPTDNYIFLCSREINHIHVFTWMISVYFMDNVCNFPSVLSSGCPH